MFRAKKIKLTDNQGLILHKKTNEGCNTYLVKPHKSGDLNSYKFEEVKTVPYKTLENNNKKENQNQKTLYKVNVHRDLNAQKQPIQAIQPMQQIQQIQSIQPIIKQIQLTKPVQIKTVQQNQPTYLTQTKPSMQPKQQLNMIVKQSINHPKIQPGNLNIIRKCLLIGINYIGSNNQQNECINDCEKLRNFLVTNKYFNSNEMTIMTDFTSGALNPSKRNIMNQLDLLLKFARSNPKKQILLFVSYSGHGHTVCNITNDKNNDKLAVLCPIDYQSAGFIGDDELRNKFINQLPSNVKLILLIDACHNEPMLDLKYRYKVDDKNTYTVFGKLLPTICDVVVISGCRDNNQYDYKGAIIEALLSNYQEINNYNELIANMKKWLKDNEYTQFPQLTSGKLIDIENKFILSSFK